jgi:hypothetical protein
MNILAKLRRHQAAARNARSIDRALRSAPTQAMRDEILLISQRHGG